jgi:hypothetical protein
VLGSHTNTEPSFNANHPVELHSQRGGPAAAAAVTAITAKTPFPIAIELSHGNGSKTLVAAVAANTRVDLQQKNAICSFNASGTHHGGRPPRRRFY